MSTVFSSVTTGSFAFTEVAGRRVRRDKKKVLIEIIKKLKKNAGLNWEREKKPKY